MPFTVEPGALDTRYRLVGSSTSYPRQGRPTQTSLLFGTRDPAGPQAGEDRVEVGVRAPQPSAEPGATIGGVPAVISADEIVLLPPGGGYGVFARAAEERTMRALVQAVKITS